MRKKRPDLEEGELATGSGAPRARENNLQEAIGIQVRSLRKQHDMTVAELAGQAGLSVGMLSKIENGGICPSLHTLQALAQALNVPITAFFEKFEERNDALRGVRGRVDRAARQGGYRYQLLGHSWAAMSGGPPRNLSEAPPYSASATRWVRSPAGGRVDYRHGDRLFEMGRGLFFDMAAPHGPGSSRTAAATALDHHLPAQLTLPPDDKSLCPFATLR